MKHLLTVLLAATLVLTAAFVFTACGETEDLTDDTTASDAVLDNIDTENTEATDDTTVAEDESVFPTELSDVAAYMIPDLSYTTWTLAGGMADGKEFEEADLEKLLELIGGMLEFSFYADNEVQLERADKTLTGTYTILLDGMAFEMDFSSLAYYAVMTDVQGTPVIVISPVGSPDQALYLTQIEVG